MSATQTTGSAAKKPLLYTGAYRRDLDEPETPTSGEQTPETPDNSGEPNRDTSDHGNTSPEEVTFKKRYGDLRRHTDKKIKELQDEINALKQANTQLATGPKSLPKTPEEIDAWRQQYPEAYSVIESIVAERVVDRTREIEGKLKPVMETNQELLREKALLILAQRHPDYVELQGEELEEWASTHSNPNYYQWLFVNDTDGNLAADALDAYKLAKGLHKPKQERKKQEKTKKVDASLDVGAQGSQSEPLGQEGRIWKESEIIKLKPHEWDLYEADIEAAARDGRLIYDVKGQD